MTTTVQLAPTIQQLQGIDSASMVEITAEQLIDRIKVQGFNGPIYFGIFTKVEDLRPKQFYHISEWFVLNKVNPTANIKQFFDQKFYSGKYYIERSK